MEIIKIKEGSKIEVAARRMSRYGHKNYPTSDMYYATVGYILEKHFDLESKADRKTAREAIKALRDSGRQAEALDLIKKYNN
jgi:hypothetical protein